MSFDDHPCVSYNISEESKQATDQFLEEQRATREKITFSIYKLCNVTTVPSDPATAYCFVMTTYQIKWGKNDSDEAIKLLLKQNLAKEESLQIENLFKNSKRYHMASKFQITKTLQKAFVSKMELMFTAIKGREDNLKTCTKRKAEQNKQTTDSCSDTSNEDIPSQQILSS